MCRESGHTQRVPRAGPQLTRLEAGVITEDSTGDDSASELIWVAGEIHFLAVAGLRCWRFAHDGLVAAHSSLPCGPLGREFEHGYLLLSGQQESPSPHLLQWV